MRVLLLDEQKITKMTLPNEIDGVFILKYKPVDSKVIKEIGIESKDGKWTIKSNESIGVLVGNTVENEVVLEDYMNLKIILIDRQEVLDFYCLPTLDTNFSKANILLY